MARQKTGRTSLMTRPPDAAVERLKQITEQTTYFSVNQLISDLLEAALALVDDPVDPPAIPLTILRLRYQLRGAPAPDSRVDSLAAQIRELSGAVEALARKVESLRPTSAGLPPTGAERRASGHA
jgi:hypothetical protein